MAMRLPSEFVCLFVCEREDDVVAMRLPSEFVCLFVCLFVRERR